MRQHCCDLGEEGVGQNCSHLFIATAAGIPHQLTNVHVEGIGETLKRTQRGNSLAVLDFGDVGPGHLHATGQLALAQVASATNLSYLARDLQTRLSTGGYGWG